MATFDKKILGLIFLMAPSIAFSESDMLTEKIDEIDFNKCGSAAKKVSSFITGNGKKDFGYNMQWGPDTNNDMLTFTVENTYSDGAILNMGSIAPTTAGDCDVVRTQVAYYEDSCMTVVSDLLDQPEPQGKLNKEWNQFKDEANTYFLKNISQGCLTVTKEYGLGLEMD